MRPVHRHALRLVDGRGIAVVDAVIVFQVERDRAAIIGLHADTLGADLFDGAERSILHAEAALVLQEHDAIPGGKAAISAFDGDAHLLAQIARAPHPVAGGLVEFPHLGIGMGEDDAAGMRFCLPVPIPAVNQIFPRLLAGGRFMHHVVAVISMDCRAGFAGRQIAGSVTLPVLTLAANLADLCAAMKFVDRPERRTGFDGLQLLRIADQHNLCANLGGMGIVRAPTAACRPCPPRR